jgi:cation transport ATPase
MIKDPNPKTISQTCDLCGLPLRYGTVNAVFSGDTYAFCCNGCRQVFTILMEATDSPNPETFLVSNMWCSACAWVIDESLKKTPGIVDSTCNFSTDRLQVNYDPVKLSPDQIIETIGKLGYRAAKPGESEKTTERRREFIRFAVSAFLTMNIMMLSFALYTGFFTNLSPENAAKISWPMFVMATAVLIYGGYDFYKKAWAGLRHAALSSVP